MATESQDLLGGAMLAANCYVFLIQYSSSLEGRLVVPQFTATQKEIACTHVLCLRTMVSLLYARNLGQPGIVACRQHIQPPICDRSR